MGNDIIKQEAVTNLARTLDVDNVSMLNMLAKTACKDIQNDDEMLAFVIICANYQLNPLVKEIYAFKNSFGAIVPVVGVDGWLAIANRNPQFDGVQCEAIFDNDKVAAIKCTIWRKDRSHPAIHTEYMRACKGTSKPWVSHPERMLEWKAIIQTIRIAFSISGIYDPDEAELIEADVKPLQTIDFADEIPDAEYTEKPSDVMKKKIADKTPKTNAGATVVILENSTGKNVPKLPGVASKEFNEKFPVNSETEPLFNTLEAKITKFSKKWDILYEEAKLILTTKENINLKTEELEKKYKTATKAKLVKLANKIVDLQAQEEE